MFLSFSKALKRMGGFRIGVGMRLTKKNAFFMLFVLFFVYMLQVVWYVIVGVCWLIYLIFYFPFYLFNKIIKK